MSEIISLSQTQEIKPQFRISRRAFLRLALFSGLSTLSGDQRKSLSEQPKETGIIQTGVQTLEIEGKKYGIKINRDKFMEMVLYEAPYFNNTYPPTLPDKVRLWASQNALEVQVYDGLTNPFMYGHEGFFMPSELNLLSRRSVLGIRNDQIMQLAVIKNGKFDYKYYVEHDMVQQIDPFQFRPVISHEIGHFLNYVHDPKRALEIAGKINSFLKDKIINVASSLFAFGLGFKFFVASRRNEKPLGTLASATLIVAATEHLLKQLTELGFLIYEATQRDIEIDDLHNSYGLAQVEQLGRRDAKFQNLLYDAFDFPEIAP